MDDSKVPVKVKHFIYKYIDSVEILEVLLYLNLHSQEWKTVSQIDRELKTQSASISKRLLLLKSYGLVEENTNELGSYRYLHKSPEDDQIISLLIEEYRIRRHQIYEIIFSQKTNLKVFADAFCVEKKNRNGEENG